MDASTMALGLGLLVLVDLAFALPTDRLSSGPGGSRTTHGEGTIVIPELYEPSGRKIIDWPSRDSRRPSRTRRDVTGDASPGSIEGYTLRLNLGADVTSMRLHRLSGSHLVSASARFEWVHEEYTETWRLDQPCMYAGQQQGLGANQSLPDAVLSVCHGVRGVIPTEGGDVYIEPLAPEEPSETSGPGAHMVHVNPRHDSVDVTNDSPDRPRYSDWSPGRVRRSAVDRSERYIEVLVVVDRSVVRFHGENLVEQYLLTQMNLVNQIYHHPSLGMIFNIIVVKIMLINDREMGRILARTGDGKDTLENFCMWLDTVRPDTSSPTYHEDNFDVAVLITREEIGPAGYAPVTGMCQWHRSCAVVKDDGISSAFVIAHEIGHIFGMVHDGYGNKCDKENTDGKIMAAMVQSTYDKYYWTDCSRKVLEETIPNIHCLNDKPTDPTWPVYSQPYGQSWSLDEQCRQEFGPDYELCKALGMDKCQYLWCSTDKKPTYCKTKRGPPLPGTSCGRNKWCMEGECTYKQEDVAVDGEWTAWGDWTECSISCGVGAQHRYRTCSDPRPQHGGQDCEGLLEEFRLCNTESCPYPVDFRAEQCTQHNAKTFVGRRRHHWQPIENKNESKLCKLTCISPETEDVFVTDANAIDGTFCSYEKPNDACVKGTCHQVGCDGILNSSAREDDCGVCQGDGSSCKRMSGLFEKELVKKEYHRLLVLPTQTRDIKVQEKRGTHLAHFLAVRDIDSEIFILSGKAKNDHSKQFVIHGARFVYANKGRGESLVARGPLLAPVEIMIYSLSSKLPTEIEYSYTIPLEAENSLELVMQPIDEDRYIWQLKGWSECSQTCGEGVEFEEHFCVDRKKEQVSVGLCSLFSKPKSDQRPCNRGHCSSHKWITAEWQECSATCGAHGTQHRYMYCSTFHYGKEQQVNPAYCGASQRPKYQQQCNRMPCPAEWSVTEWSQCSATCGSGVQRRDVTCDKPQDGNRYTCGHKEPPADTRLCEQRPCPGMEIVSHTSSASVTDTQAESTTATANVPQTMSEIGHTLNTTPSPEDNPASTPPPGHPANSDDPTTTQPPSPSPELEELAAKHQSALATTTPQTPPRSTPTPTTPPPTPPRTTSTSKPTSTTPPPRTETPPRTTSTTDTPPTTNIEILANNPDKGKGKKRNNRIGRKINRKNGRRRSKLIKISPMDNLESLTGSGHFLATPDMTTNDHKVPGRVVAALATSKTVSATSGSVTAATPTFSSHSDPTQTQTNPTSTSTGSPSPTQDSASPSYSSTSSPAYSSTSSPAYSSTSSHKSRMRLCFEDKSRFCRMASDAKNCAIRPYWERCCHSCKIFHTGTG